MNDILNRIVKQKHLSIEKQKKYHPLSIKSIKPKTNNSFLNKNEKMIIAELKKASPSKGKFDLKDDIIGIAKKYIKSNVDAISILTEEKYFLGSTDILKRVREFTNIPILRKDFIIDSYQIYESAIIGADAILLIVRILDNETLRSFINIAHSLGLKCLVEVHSKEEIDAAISCGAKIIGINSRDLKSFKIDLNNIIDNAKYIRKNYPDIKIVGESGIKSIETAINILKITDAILVGEFLVSAEDPCKIISTIKNNI